MQYVMPNDLSNALDQISEIRRQMARGSVFRGYRAQTTALTGVLALVAAAVQERIIPHPWQNLPGYLGVWCGLAVLCAASFSIELIVRCRRLASPMQIQRTAEAAERFIPSLAAGAILTVVFFRSL